MIESDLRSFPFSWLKFEERGVLSPPCWSNSRSLLRRSRRSWFLHWKRTKFYSLNLYKSKWWSTVSTLFIPFFNPPSLAGIRCKPLVMMIRDKLRDTPNFLNATVVVAGRTQCKNISLNWLKSPVMSESFSPPEHLSNLNFQLLANPKPLFLLFLLRKPYKTIT